MSKSARRRYDLRRRSVLSCPSARRAMIFNTGLKSPVSDADPDGKLPCSFTRNTIRRPFVSTSSTPAAISLDSAVANATASCSVSPTSAGDIVDDALLCFALDVSCGFASAALWRCTHSRRIRRRCDLRPPLDPLARRRSKCIGACTPNALRIVSAMRLYFSTSIDENDNRQNNTKKHISSAIRSAKVTIQPGARSSTAGVASM